VTDSRTVGICVATYKRPTGLSLLLTSLAELEIPDSHDIAVVVVDNDAEGSGRAIVDAWVEQHSTTPNVSIAYGVEPTQGIPYVRNLGTEMALAAGADLLAYIDDDEWAEPAWLDELVSAMHRHSAPIVSGFVQAEYESPPPQWAVDLGTFQRKTWPDGHKLDYAITANVLLDAQILRGEHRPFDETLRFSGGSDLQLFQRLHREGHNIVFAPLARTHEVIPATRMNKQWAIRRQYRRGLNRSTTLRLLDFGPKTVTKRIFGAGKEVAFGCLIYLGGVARGEVERLRGRTRLAYGWGMLIGLTGRQYDEYRITHGS
jgi:succinoglycan biosynthesis protein ExoM